MAKVYQVSGTVFQRNEFMAGYQDYVLSWPVEGSGQHITDSSPEELESQIRDQNPERHSSHILQEIRDLKVEYVCEFEWNADGKAPLCGDNPDGSHWSWLGNHEPNCQYVAK